MMRSRPTQILERPSQSARLRARPGTNPRDKHLKAFRSIILALTAVFALAQIPAQAQNIQAGREYIVLDPPRAVATGPKIEILEFFYYGCPVCYEFQPLFSRWLNQAPEYIALRRIPAVGNESQDTFAKLFHSLEATGQIGRLHWPIYDNYHFDGVKLNEEAVLVDWVTRNGVDREQFQAAFASDAVKAKMAETEEMMKAMNIRGVPTIVIDGKYLTSARLAGGTRRLPQVIDQLVKQARGERPN